MRVATGPHGAAPVNGQTGAAPPHESELVRRAVVALKRGDQSALHFLYVRYADEVRRFVKSIVRDEHEAEDITHDVFARLIRAIRHYEPRDVPFVAWIMRVARNAALDHLRTRRQIPCEEIRASEEGYEQVGRERSQSLCEAFRRLPQDQRDVLVLRHIAGLSPPEIARRIGKTEGAVHGLHHRGRGTLQAVLRELDATPTVAV
jgi:RNA polymerase sigma-70 factor, ECF subfamily